MRKSTLNLAEQIDQKIIDLTDKFFGENYSKDIETEELVKLRCFCAIGVGSIFVAFGCALLYFLYDLEAYRTVLTWPIVLGLSLYIVRKEGRTQTAFIIVGLFLVIYWPLILSETRTTHGPVNCWLILMPMWFTFMGGIWPGILGGIYSVFVLLGIHFIFDFPEGHIHYFPEIVYIIEYVLIVMSSVFISIGLYRISRHVYVNAESKNKDLHEFVGNMSHDLRNPIGSSVSYIDLIMNEYDELSKEEVLACLKSARNGMDLSLEMCEEVLDMSLIESGEISLQLRTISVSELVENVRAMVIPFCRRKGVTLSIENTLNDTQSLLIDSAKLERVLQNLIVNAVKFSQKEEQIKFRIEVVTNLVLFSVVDYGIGMSKEVIDSIQNDMAIGRLGTLGEKTTGLGLKIVKSFLNLHNSELFIESKPGEVTNCYFYIKKGDQ